MAANGVVLVCARFKPLEWGEEGSIDEQEKEQFTLKDANNDELRFRFDQVFYGDSEQKEVYEFLARPSVRGALDGYNRTIIVYGQTKSGKTYTLEGPKVRTKDETRGSLARAVEEIFNSIESSGEAINYKIELSMLQIYRERVRDLLDIDKYDIDIANANEGLSSIKLNQIRDRQHALLMLQGGFGNREVLESYGMPISKSHFVYIFTIHGVRKGKLVFVDVAGSDEIENIRADENFMQEAKSIKESIVDLGIFISALKTRRECNTESFLTQILQHVVGGCSGISLCCCVKTPYNSSDSLSMLRFGERAKICLPWTVVACARFRNINWNDYSKLGMSLENLNKCIVPRCIKRLDTEQFLLKDENSEKHYFRQSGFLR